MNWQPTYQQIGTTETLWVIDSSGTTATKCTGDAVCNSPGVWSLESQQAAVDGTDSSGLGEVFKVAFKQYHRTAGSAAQPVLYFVPASPLMGSDELSSCFEGAAPQLAAAGDWSYTVAYGSGAAQQGSKVGKAGRIQVPQEPWADNVETCATITVTVSGYAVSPSPAGLPASLTSSHTVCWYRHDGQASAKFDFQSCADPGGFAVNVSSIKPLAQLLTQNGKGLAGPDGGAALLFQPVIQVFGSLRKTVNGTVLKSTPQFNGEGATYVINKYFLVPPETTAADVITIPLDTGDLAEGCYRLSAKVSVVSRYPGLVDLQGEALISQEDMPEVAGFSEYMGFLVLNGSNDSTPLVGLQRSGRKVQLAAISSNKVGKAIQAGDPITFEWQFYGVGTQTCYHDGELLTKCSSPLTLPAKAFAVNASQTSLTAKANHTFEVVFVDVCGNRNVANFTYSAAGVVGLSAVDYVDANEMVTEGAALLTGGSSTQRLSIREGSSAGRTRFGFWAAAAAAAVSMLAVLL
uniref:Uncharacterized protein n=1 Tax=Tetradesmus obliquus TaxID=3088 RepID=A0A383VQ16_TETOB|eukprot:jgi/Sobl393_1/9106/SZX67271.1